LAFSGSWQTKMLFIAGGISILFLINILRLVMLGVISIEYPAHFQFAHKYLFNMIVYAITFLLWMGYVKVKHRKEINHSMNNHD
jgi:exosortase/archaeosortase family protein